MIVVFWVLLAIVVGYAGSTRGRSGFGWFLLALLISPLIAAFVLMLIRNLAEPAITPATHVRCPDCAELILKQANVCKHCGCRLIPQ